jgi:hypothetical protein
MMAMAPPATAPGITSNTEAAMAVVNVPTVLIPNNMRFAVNQRSTPAIAPVLMPVPNEYSNEFRLLTGSMFNWGAR